ncbi:MAG: glycoside hydrolase family 9 protein [Ignavibacteriaceae bacterium]
MKRLYSFLNNLIMIFHIPVPVIFFTVILFNTALSQESRLKINNEEYFETPGLNVLVFSNKYNGYFFDEKTAGIELIHHGVRTATNGAVRLRATPEQWDLVPMLIDRKVDKENNSIEVKLQYEKYNFDSKIVVTAKDQGVMIDVFLDKPLPKELEGHAGFNLEFLPSAYFEKTYFMDGRPGIIPKYPAGPMVVKPLKDRIPQYFGLSTFDDRGRDIFVDPLPIAEGKKLVLAPEDSAQRVDITSMDGDLMLYDGRNVAQNGWFVVRSLIPSNKTGKVVEWYLTASTIKNWIRKPVIGFSQVGYYPTQEKVAVMELDKNDTPYKTATLLKVMPDGSLKTEFAGDVKIWGSFLRYNYARFDFSSVRDSGLYIIQYGNQRTNTFPIDTRVYDNVWHQTLDVFLPVQMDHVFVKDAYRVWHGVPFLDDARQAPPNLQLMDNKRMGPSTDTRYKPGEHIMGLNVGGWFDAGDFDVEEVSQCRTISALAASWEQFKPDLDETYINQKHRYVGIHDPDGKPDMLQQIEHGVLLQLAMQKAFGRAIPSIEMPHLYQYVHLGDASTITDNLIYDPNLKPFEVKGDYSGKFDDRWAITTNEPWMNYSSIACLANASRAFKGYNDSLSSECITAAENSWDRQQKDTTKGSNNQFAILFGAGMTTSAALQLYISTNNKKYADAFTNAIWQGLERFPELNIENALIAIPYFGKEYKAKLEPYIKKLKVEDDSLLLKNPYGVPIGTRHWGGNEEVVRWAITNFYAHKEFPNIIGPEYTLRGIDYLFGCHPYSNLSFVADVGTHSKEVIYGRTRADFSNVAGGVVPGLLMLEPDYLENKDDWPFFWGENECVIDIAASYIFLSNAVNALLKGNI